MANYSLCLNQSSDFEDTVSADFQLLAFFGKPYLYMVVGLEWANIWREEECELIAVEDADAAAEYAHSYLMSIFARLDPINSSEICEKATTYQIHITRAIHQQFPSYSCG